MAAGTKLDTKIKNNIKFPLNYRVIMYNDDFTTMEFVVEVLTGIFHKEQEEAIALMMKVHKEGRALVGAYSYDMAMTKTQEAMHLAREQGYPFQIKVEG